jgi:hypothetical protein
MRLLWFALVSAAQAAILYPPPGSVLPGKTVTFTWERLPGANDYSLNLSAQPNAAFGEIYNSPARGFSHTVTNIPCNGQTIYVIVRAWTGAVATPFSAIYTAPTNCSADPRATIVNPAPGKTLFSSHADFRWSTPPGATGYWLDIGTARGHGNISAGFQTSNTRTVTNLPCNEQTLWARLWTQTASGYLTPIDYQYTASASCIPPATARITSPAGGERIQGRSIPIEWTPVPGAIGYKLELGTLPRGADLYSQFHTGTAAKIVVANCFYSFMFASLTSYTAAGNTLGDETWFGRPINCSNNSRGQMISPTPGSTLASSVSATFTWSLGEGATGYWLDVGTSPGGASLFGAEVTGTQATVYGLPCDNSTVYVRLWTRDADGYFPPFDYSYTAPFGTCAPSPVASMLSPAVGSVLTTTAPKFLWTAGPGAIGVWLDVGTAQGKGDIFASFLSGSEREVFGLPCDGSRIHVRLWTRTISGYLRPVDYTYTATTNCATEPRAKLLNAVPPTGASVVLQWSPGINAQDYWLDVGTKRGIGDILATHTPNTQAGVINLPTGVNPIHVRLWTRRNGVWLPPIDYEFGRP